LTSAAALQLDPDLDWSGYLAGPVGAHEKFGVFDSNFETAMRAVFGVEYETRENEAKVVVGEAKPLIARFAARSLTPPPDAEPSAWDALKPLAARVAALPAAPIGPAP
jgi:hypothetical protein